MALNSDQILTSFYSTEYSKSIHVYMYDIKTKLANIQHRSYRKLSSR